MEININGQVVVIDDEDAALLLSLTLTVDKRGYVSVRGSRRKGHGCEFLHRVLMNTPDGKHTDHANGNTLDNRRANLRVCSPAENLRNRRPRKATNSGYKGVLWSKNKGTWRACCTFQGRRYMCGTSSDPIKAAKKYDRKARELHGEFARPNFSCGCGLEVTCSECGAVSPWKR